MSKDKHDDLIVEDVEDDHVKSYISLIQKTGKTYRTLPYDITLGNITGVLMTDISSEISENENLGPGKPVI